MRLHNWAFDDPSVFERVFGDLTEGTGAVIMGRRSYDNSIQNWGGVGPLGEVGHRQEPPVAEVRRRRRGQLHDVEHVEPHPALGGEPLRDAERLARAVGEVHGRQHGAGRARYGRSGR